MPGLELGSSCFCAQSQLQSLNSQLSQNREMRMYTPDDRLGLEQTHKNTKDTMLSRLLPLASVESSGSNCSPCSGPCVKVDSSQTGWPCLWLSVTFHGCEKIPSSI